MTTTAVPAQHTRAWVEQELAELADVIDQADLEAIRVGLDAYASPIAQVRVSLRREALVAMVTAQAVLPWDLVVALLDRVLRHQVPARRYYGWIRLRSAAADQHYGPAMVAGVAADVAAHR